MAYDAFKNVFASDNGDLISKIDCTVIRPKYSYTFKYIKTSLQLRATIRNGKTAWPGGYPLFLVNNDGDCICFKCAKSEYKSLSRDLLHNGNMGCDINYENDDLFCEYCDKQIESAYGEDNATDD